MLENLRIRLKLTPHSIVVLLHLPELSSNNVEDLAHLAKRLDVPNVIALSIEESLRHRLNSS